MSFRYAYGKGRIAGVATQLTESDTLDSELRAVRQLLQKHIELNTVNLLYNDAAFQVMVKLLNRVVKMALGNQRIRSQKALSPSERANIMAKMKGLLVNYIPRERMGLFQAGVNARFGLLNTATADPHPLTDTSHALPAPEGKGVADFLPSMRKDDWVTPDVSAELALIRAALATLFETHEYSLTESFVEAEEDEDVWAAEKRFNQLLDLLKLVERAATSNSQIKAWQEQTREELLVWAGHLLTEALRHILPENLHAFSLAVRSELGLRLGDVTTMIELKDDYGVWTDGTSDTARGLALGDKD